MSNSECIKVIVRCRPMNKSENARGNIKIIQINQQRGEITIESSEKSKVFSYDAVFDENDKQQNIYEQTAFQLVDQVTEGYNGTIFAYGQTGCGKTHTMVGDPASDEQKGIIPRTFQHIMNIVENAKEKKFLIRCSYIEIYNEEIRDLLSKDVKAKRDIKESVDKGVFIKDLNLMVCKNIKEMDQYMNQGNSCRSTGATLMNADSSRSHSLFSLYIECQQLQGKTENITAGKLNLVDLAGSERQSKTGATGDRLKEANKINLSLAALGNVISALVDGKSSHIPYRDSKLTRLLQDSLGGNTKTIMIAAVSPADYNYDETMGTLRYASRAKNIINKPKINEDPKDTLLKSYLDEIQKLKSQLQNQGQKTTISRQIETGDNQQLQQEKEIIHLELKLKDEQYAREKQEREKLEKDLITMEQQILKANQEQDEKINKKYNQIRKHLEEENKLKEELLIEKQRQEDELQDAKQICNSVQEEVQKLRNAVQKMKKKIKFNEQEIKDNELENEQNKEDLLETIRFQEKDQIFLENLVKIMLTEDELQKIRALSEWQDDQKIFYVPNFNFKDQKVLKIIQGKIAKIIKKY